jgi:predicted NUDIX family phosphoesterase
MSEAQVERVLVVPTELFRRLGYFQGFSREVDRYLPGLLDPGQMSFRPRSEVEHDPSFKQLIPYVLLRHRGSVESVFQYTRGTGMGEGRLHRKRSVGIGGHISLSDLGGRTDVNPYLEGMRRELDEEVIVESPYTAQCVGLINDDQTDVGQVHLGLVHLLDLDEPRVRPREDDVVECQFRPVADILADMDGFETWSQICMQALFGAPQSLIPNP